MTPPPDPAPALAAFARGENDLDDVTRALVAFDGWLAPAGPTPSMPANELWLFTDADAVERAWHAGSDPGPLAPPRAGVDVFADLAPGLAVVRVNPGSPAEVTWNLPDRAFPLATVWAAAVRFERALARSAAGGVPDPELVRGFDGFLALFNPDGEFVTLPGEAGLANPAVVFTAPDCARDFLAGVPDPPRAGLTRTFPLGRELLRDLPGQGIDGLVFNPAGPGPAAALPFAAVTRDP